MISPQTIARQIIDSFDATSTTTVERICEELLKKQGLSASDACEQADVMSKPISRLLRKESDSNLPFYFSDRHPNRLIGKQRVRADDSPQTVLARAKVSLVPEIIDSICNAGSCTFERICAGLMSLSGAQEVYAGCASDDGGIDVYGRLPLRTEDTAIRAGLLETALLKRQLFFVGQCKCYARLSTIGRPHIDAFSGALQACLTQYEGNNNPPSHRVPANYYRRNEACIPLFFSTAVFSSDAQTAADSMDIILIDGRQIAEFLLHHQVGVSTDDSATFAVDDAALVKWANKFSAKLV